MPTLRDKVRGHGVDAYVVGGAADHIIIGGYTQAAFTLKPVQGQRRNEEPGSTSRRRQALQRLLPLVRVLGEGLGDLTHLMLLEEILQRLLCVVDLAVGQPLDDRDCNPEVASQL